MKSYLEKYNPITITTFPFDILRTEDAQNKNHTIRHRYVACQYCKYTTLSDAAGPKCLKCNEYMITIIAKSETNELD